MSQASISLSSRKKMAYLLMVGAVLKHLITGEYGPLDRILEFLVFALILYEVINGIRHHRRNDKRQKFLNEQRDFIAGFIPAGEELKVSLPGMSGTPALTPEHRREAEAWRQKTSLWISSTAETLGQRSPRARSAFMNVTETSYSPSMAWKADGSPWYAAEDVAPSFRKLLAHLDNLHKMLANPEPYF